ncbi:MAG: NADH-quinone oxidoreductase subunit A [Dehalococcoidales bacterium]|nr:NADH-quinone oxidoreductase subunit A [Dehalococcoidales bacterium]
MLTAYGYIAIFLVIAIGFGIVPLIISSLLRPKRPDPVKLSTYECGVETIGPTWVQFRVGFYLYALVFVIFDVETVFLYPWAVAYGKLGLYALVEMFVFVLLLAVGLAYAWRKRALVWK